MAARGGLDGAAVCWRNEYNLGGRYITKEHWRRRRLIILDDQGLPAVLIMTRKDLIRETGE